MARAPEGDRTLETINWALAIEKNRDALLRIVEVLFAIAGLTGNVILGPDPRMPRCTRNYLYRILRPAESAVRRLIVIAARNIKLDVRPSRSAILGLEAGARQQAERSLKAGQITRTHSVKPEPAAMAKNHKFLLLDPLKRFSFDPPKRYAMTMPRVRSLSGWSLPVYMRQPEPSARREPSPDDEVDAASLCIRLHTLKHALDDLDGHAKRLARWRARRDLRLRQPDHRPGRLSPMRPGWPPGHRKRRFHEIDDILAECHSLAVYAQRLDTS